MRAIKDLTSLVFGTLLALSAGAAPTITSQPVRTAVGPGQPGSLSVTATGTAPLSYQWLKEGFILLDQTNSTLSFGSLQLTNSGSYQVVVSDTTGLTISRPAILSVVNLPVYGWGFNNASQLTGVPFFSTNRPVLMISNVAVAVAGQVDSLYLKTDGTVWGTGYNFYGELGDGTYDTADFPIRCFGGLSNVVAVAAGIEQVFVLTGDGVLSGIGDNTYGQLGSKVTTSGTNRLMVMATNVVAIASGDSHCLYVTADGKLWTVGYNGYGQLGNGDFTDSSVPQFVTSGVVAVTAGSHNCLYLKADGTLWGMGENAFGEFGRATTENPYVSFPVKITQNVVAVAEGGLHTLYVTRDNLLWAMGWNLYGQLGNRNFDNTSEPSLIDNQVVAISGGERCSLYARSDGGLWVMGVNEEGELADGTLTSSSVPLQVGGLTVGSIAKAQSADDNLVVAGAPLVVTPLTNRIVTLGQSFSLTAVVAEGTGPYTYQWQLNLTNLPGANNATYNVASAAAGNLGTYTVVVSGPLATAGASATVNTQVTILPATVSLTSLNQTYDGTAKGTTYTTSPAGLTATITYNGLTTPPTNAGSYTVAAIITTSGYAGGVTNTLVINKAAQSISFGPITNIVFGDAPITLTASATSGLPVSYASSAPSTATTSNNVVFLLAPGSTTITASQAGNSNYLAASNIGQDLVIQSLVVGLNIRRTTNAAILTLTGNPGRLYNLLYNEDLKTNYWPLLQSIASLPATNFEVVVPTNRPYRFYRLQRPVWTP